MQLFRLGDHGLVVAELRATLVQLGLLAQPTVSVDHDAPYDADCDRAVRAFQQQRGLTVDGIVGPETYRSLDEARWRLGDRSLSFAVSRPLTGDDVAVLQSRLNELGFNAGRADGVFGPETERALRDFQRNVGLRPDGTCGPKTLRYLRQLARSVVGGRPQWMREREVLHRSGPALAGKTVVVDAGHGGTDAGVCAHGMTERDIATDLAAKVEGRLLAAGVTAYQTRPLATAQRSSAVAMVADYGATPPSDAERAAFANAADADLLVSLHVDGAPSRRCQGVATYYFGTAAGGGSAVGEQLAGLVQREIVARTGLLDCHTHGKTWQLLRLTQMPAVRVELGYLSNDEDAAMLARPTTREEVAEAILVAVQRLYLPADLDPPTGQLCLSAIAG